MAPLSKGSCKYYWTNVCVPLARLMGYTCACILVLAQVITQTAASRPSIYATTNSLSSDIDGLTWKWEEAHESRKIVSVNVGRGIRITCVGSAPYENIQWRKRMHPEQNITDAWLDMTSFCSVVRDSDDYSQAKPKREGHGGRGRERCSITTLTYSHKGKERRNSTLAFHSVTKEDYGTYSCGPSEVHGSELAKDDAHAFVILDGENSALRNYVEIEGRLKRSSKDSHSPWHIYTEEKLGKQNNDSSEDKGVTIPPHRIRSLSVIEGMSTDITCEIQAATPGKMFQKFWYKDGARLFSDDGKFNMSTNDTHFTLTIQSAKLEDRGVYNCSVLDGETVASTQGLLVRVKGKMAPLWPFITICVELVVLSIIILVYEKSKNKEKIEESDTDGSPDQKVSENNDPSEASRLQKEN